MVKKSVLISVVVILAVIGLLPLLVMFLRSVTVEGHFSLAAYKGLLASKNDWILLKHSLTLSFLTTLFCAIIGVPLGILLAKTDIPFRGIFVVIFTIPLLIAPYIMAVSWFNLLGREGLLARFWGERTAVATSEFLFGLPGCVLVLFSTYMPVVMLLTITFLKTINPRLEEAGKIITRWPDTLKGITIPLIMPGILLSCLLVFLLTLGEFGVPMFLRYNVYPVETFTQFSAFYDFGAATAGAIPLALITGLAILFERIFLRKKTYQVKLASEGNRTIVICLGRFRKWFAILVGLLCFFMVILPLLVLVLQSMSFNAYARGVDLAGDSLVRSLSYAAIGASVLTIIGFFCGYIIHNRSLFLWQSMDSLTLFLFALPGTLIGIGLVLLWNKPVTNFVYATPIIIIFGYITQYTALTSRVTVSMLAQIPASMEEAAQIVGAGWLRRIGCIVCPLAKRGLVAGWLIAYIFCLRDMRISMLVYPPGHDTLPVRTFTLMANGSADLIAALCVIMVLATLLPLGILAVVFRSRGLTE